jgi:hypothetical protein
MPRRYSHNLMCRLGAAVVLRSACTPAAVALGQSRRSRDLSAGRLLNARIPTSVTLIQLQLRRLRHVSAGRSLTARTPSSVTVRQKKRSSESGCSQLAALCPSG